MDRALAAFRRTVELRPDDADAYYNLGVVVGEKIQALVNEKVAAYRKAVAAAEPISASVTNHFACTPPALVLEDDHKACQFGFRGARFFAEALGRYYFGRDRPTGTLPVPRTFLADDDLRLAMRNRNAPGSSMNLCVGDPASAREFVQRFIEIGIDELIFIMQMGTVPMELVTESVRTFGEKVIPYFS